MMILIDWCVLVTIILLYYTATEIQGPGKPTVAYEKLASLWMISLVCALWLIWLDIKIVLRSVPLCFSDSRLNYILLDSNLPSTVVYSYVISTLSGGMHKQKSLDEFSTPVRKVKPNMMLVFWLSPNISYKNYKTMRRVKCYSGVSIMVFSFL